MPIYEFYCPTCHNNFENLMKMKDPFPNCPACGFAKVEKLISCGAVRPEGIPRGQGGFSAPACSGGSCKKMQS